MGVFSNTDRFVKKAQQIHGNRFDYSLVQYERNYMPITIICREHGPFEQRPDTHLRGSVSCSECYLIKKVRTCTRQTLNKKFKGIIQPEDHKLLPLPNGIVTKVDNDMFEELSKHPWHLSAGYVRNSKIGSMSRYVLKCEDGKEADHRNRDKLDNRRENLRESNRCENVSNIPGYDKTSKFKGVSWRSDVNKWVAGIASKNERYHLGYFKSEEVAAKAYDAAAKKLHGEFAFINFPES